LLNVNKDTTHLKDVANGFHFLLFLGFVGFVEPTTLAFTLDFGKAFLVDGFCFGVFGLLALLGEL
jgi:hypothetical protein